MEECVRNREKVKARLQEIRMQFWKEKLLKQTMMERVDKEEAASAEVEASNQKLKELAKEKQQEIEKKRWLEELEKQKREEIRQYHAQQRQNQEKRPSSEPKRASSQQAGSPVKMFLRPDKPENKGPATRGPVNRGSANRGFVMRAGSRGGR